MQEILSLQQCYVCFCCDMRGSTGDVFGVAPVSAHSGGVDRNNCHVDNSTGGHHCHGGNMGTQSSRSQGVKQTNAEYDQTQVATALFCRPWLQELLSTQQGIRYIIGSIGQAALQRDYSWVNVADFSGVSQPLLVAKKSGLEIVSLQTTPMDINDNFFYTNHKKFLWAMMVRNSSERDKSFSATIQWLDDKGFILDSDNEYNLVISANEEKRFAGHHYISNTAAKAITSINAEITYTDLNNIVKLAAPITANTSN